jgi:hypothetical protein
MDFARWARHRSNYRNCSTKASHNRCTNHHRRCTKARSPTPPPARADAGYGSRVLRGCARRHDLSLRRNRRPDHRGQDRRGGAIAARLIGVWNPLWKGATGPPIKAPPRADVSTGAPPTAKMTRMLAAIRMVIARALPALSTDRTLFRLIRQFQGASRFSAARISVSSLLLERAAMSRKASPTSAVHFLSIVA